MITTTGEDANAIDPNGGDYAPIHFIVTGKHKSSRKPELLIALMIGNADIDLTTTRKGMTALHLAVKVSLCWTIVFTVEYCQVVKIGWSGAVKVRHG